MAEHIAQGRDAVLDAMAHTELPDDDLAADPAPLDAEAAS